MLAVCIEELDVLKKQESWDKSCQSWRKKRWSRKMLTFNLNVISDSLLDMRSVPRPSPRPSRHQETSLLCCKRIHSTFYDEVLKSLCLVAIKSFRNSAKKSQAELWSAPESVLPPWRESEKLRYASSPLSIKVHGQFCSKRSPSWNRRQHRIYYPERPISKRKRALGLNNSQGGIWPNKRGNTVGFQKPGDIDSDSDSED